MKRERKRERQRKKERDRKTKRETERQRERDKEWDRKVDTKLLQEKVASYIITKKWTPYRDTAYLKRLIHKSTLVYTVHTIVHSISLQILY